MKIASFTAALAATLVVACQCFGQGPGGHAYAQGPGFGGPGAPPGYGVPANYGGPVAGYGVPAGYGQPMGYGPPQGYGPPPGYGGVAPAGYGPPPGYGGVAPANYGAPEGYGEYAPQEPSDYCSQCEGEEACNCDLCACERCPNWYIRADALWLRIRENKGTPIIVNQDEPTDSPDYVVLDTGDVSSGFVAGPRITIGYPMGCYGCSQLVYWGLHNFTNTATARGDNNLSLPPDFGPATQGFFDADYVELARTTRVHNAEGNYISPETCYGVSWIGGIRYFNLRDRLSLAAADPDNAIDTLSTAQWKTETNMLGPQLGLRARKDFLCVWGVEGIAKAGLMGVSSWQRSTVIDGGTGHTFASFNRTSNIGTICEGQINATRAITDNFALRMGYNVFYLAGVATARKQLDFNQGPGEHQKVGHADMFLYGYSIGADLRW